MEIICSEISGTGIPSRESIRFFNSSISSLKSVHEEHITNKSKEEKTLSSEFLFIAINFSYTSQDD